MKRILVTGANGFIGRSLIQRLSSEGSFLIRAVYRNVKTLLSDIGETVIIPDIGPDTDWTDALNGVKVVVHTAARVHLMHDTSVDPLGEFRKVNTAGTLNLAAQAAKKGVKRFIFLSSIKVNGEETFDVPFKPEDKNIPIDPYGLSKYEAETGLKEISKKTGMEIVIIRCPLVYGPGVKANFQMMIKLVNSRIPLPLGNINNRRSLLALDNLTDFIYRCINHPKAAGEVFLLSDGEDVSTSELLKKISRAMNKRLLLIPVPVSIIRFFSKIFHMTGVYRRLFGSLQIDSSKARKLLDWEPPVKMDDALKKLL
jgi:nucleoside-diphosphate-sugar epimerase